MYSKIKSPQHVKNHTQHPFFIANECSGSSRISYRPTTMTDRLDNCLSINMRRKEWRRIKSTSKLSSTENIEPERKKRIFRMSRTFITCIKENQRILIANRDTSTTVFYLTFNCCWYFWFPYIYCRRKKMVSTFFFLRKKELSASFCQWNTKLKD